MNEAKRVAIVDVHGNVLNVIKLVPGSDWTPPKGCKVIDDEGTAEPGATWAMGDGFIPREPSSEPLKPSIDDQLADMRAEIDALKTP